jgi:hypothetical protein
MKLILRAEYGDVIIEERIIKIRNFFDLVRAIVDYIKFARKAHHYGYTVSAQKRKGERISF